MKKTMAAAPHLGNRWREPDLKGVEWKSLRRISKKSRILRCEVRIEQQKPSIGGSDGGERRWKAFQVKELIEAVNHGLESEDLDSDGGIRRTMVFANTIEAVEVVAKILNFTGLECLRDHKNCTLEERAQALVDFHEKGGVLVCTDAAARGVDIPNVLHVIQMMIVQRRRGSKSGSGESEHIMLIQRLGRAVLGRGG